MNCVVCQAPAHRLTPVIRLTQGVASDCSAVAHPATVAQCQQCGHYQKQIIGDYLQQVAAIYQHYTPYSLNEGKEQLSFSAQVPFSRCQQIISNCLDILDIPSNATFLDIGTGSGAMLQAVDSLQLGWQKSAQDVSADKATTLTQQHQLSAFYAGGIETISGTFDVVTLIHVLEHIPDPAPFLQALSMRLGETGAAIIQVPDIEGNCWDFAIFDHVSHFSQKSLLQLLAKYFQFVDFPAQQLPKELTVIVSNSAQKCGAISDSQVERPHRQFNQQLAKIAQLQDVYIMGTGPAACFCVSFLGGKVVAVLDEDATKIGKYLFGLPILDAHLSYSGPVFLPYPPPQAKQIMSRLPQHHYIF